MPDSTYSVPEYFAFLEYVSEKGLIKQATVASWKASSSRMLGLLKENETEYADLRTLDIDALASRFANLEGKKFTPSSLQVYKSRLKSSLGDFLSYADNPASYKPGISARKSRNASKKTSKSDSIAPPQASKNSKSPPRQDPPGMESFPIPLRQDLTILIQNLPFDLTEDEAERIAAVVKALAMK